MLRVSSSSQPARTSRCSFRSADTADSFNQLKVGIGSMVPPLSGVDKVDISSQEGAAKAIDVIRNAIDRVSSQRASLGATQNRLEYTINNLDTASENLQSANSRIATQTWPR